MSLLLSAMKVNNYTKVSVCTANGPQEFGFLWAVFYGINIVQPFLNSKVYMLYGSSLSTFL